MDYKCFCGANLTYSQSEDTWMCPNAHKVYSCKNCKSQGKNIPLQWIGQYQRWYCYECKEYASTSEEVKGYKLGIPRGSRVDEFCFNCRNLKLTQNNTHLDCKIVFNATDQLRSWDGTYRFVIPRFLESAIPNVTIRPTTALANEDREVSLCERFSIVSSESDIPARANLLKHIKNWVEKQIESHEKEAALVEMYRIEYAGRRRTADIGMDAFQIPVNRDNVVGGRKTVTVDTRTKKIWAHLGPRPEKRTGLASFLLKPDKGFDDLYSPRYLRDLLKRDIELFAVQKIWAGEEPAEFWQILDRGATEISHETLESPLKQPEFKGTRTELYELKYHTGKFYSEYYTGGRSLNKTKTISAEPLRTSLEELQTKRVVAALDHQTKIVWLWLGNRSGGTMKRIAKTAPGYDRYKIQILRVIGTRAGKSIDDYECAFVEEGKEPDQFKILFQN